MSKVEFIKNFFAKYPIDIKCINKKDETIDFVYQLCQNDTIDDSIQITNECADYLGIYYDCVKNDPIQAEKYYIMAINKGSKNSIHNLAFFYYQKREYELAAHYYLMDFENGNVVSADRLARCYQKIKKYDEMIKYYLIAIDNGSVHAMIELAVYFKKIENHDDMIKYYLMAIENNSTDAMRRLAIYYHKMGYHEQMIKYFLMAIEKGSIVAIFQLAKYYEKIRDYAHMTKYFLLISRRNVNIYETYKPYLGKYIQNATILDYLSLMYRQIKSKEDKLVTINNTIHVLTNQPVL